MTWLHEIIGFLHRLPLPGELASMASSLGLGLHLLLFAILFCETGLVILPFLPGDSLLFAVGALSALAGPPVPLPGLLCALALGAVLGDAANYALGRRFADAASRREGCRWLHREHLAKAHHFYEKHGPKTLILARFIPIIRTFAPFVAGIGAMSYPRFAWYNVSGAILWIGALVGLGRAFGGWPWVQQHFEAVILAIILISVLPGILECLPLRRRPS